MRARFLWVFIIALAIAALSATLALSMPVLGQLSWDVFGTSLIAAGCLLGAMLDAIVIERGRLRPLMLLSIIGWAVACLLGWTLVWYPFDAIGAYEAQELIGKITLSVSLVAGAMTAVGLLRLLRPRTELVRVVRVATETCCGAFVVVSLLVLWEVFLTWWLFPGELESRVMSGLFICSVAGLLGTPALRAAEIARRKDAAESGLPMRVGVELTCPRCGLAQTVRSGAEAACSGCGLSIRVEVEEPQCPACGYSLARLDAAACPECGERLPGGGEDAGM
ncbi:MAG: zinc ribbon domain-containing protein [Phycisphaeraceae bacterium]|nr:zinc ribbon domain-containing protein [Phycisphaeraceae bacterium]